MPLDQVHLGSFVWISVTVPRCPIQCRVIVFVLQMSSREAHGRARYSRSRSRSPRYSRRYSRSRSRSESPRGSKGYGGRRSYRFPIQLARMFYRRKEWELPMRRRSQLSTKMEERFRVSVNEMWFGWEPNELGLLESLRVSMMQNFYRIMSDQWFQIYFVTTTEILLLYGYWLPSLSQSLL